jgi:NADH-ubiquinone oxidoreductase chain 5
MSLIPSNFSRSIGYLLSLVAAFLSATYSVRLLIMTFLSKPHFPSSSLLYISEPSIPMLIPLILLGIGAAFFGFIFNETFIGCGSVFYQNSIFTHPTNSGILDASLSQPSLIKYIPLITLLSLITI